MTNNGGAITISSYAVYGVFNVTGGTCTTLSGGVLNAGASCTYTVTFTPNAAGAFTGTFTIFDTDSTGKQVVNLAGTGIQSVTFSPASLSFGQRSGKRHQLVGVNHDHQQRAGWHQQLWAYAERGLCPVEHHLSTARNARGTLPRITITTVLRHFHQCP